MLLPQGEWPDDERQSKKARKRLISTKMVCCTIFDNWLLSIGRKRCWAAESRLLMFFRGDKHFFFLVDHLLSFLFVYSFFILSFFLSFLSELGFLIYATWKVWRNRLQFLFHCNLVILYSRLPKFKLFTIFFVICYFCSTLNIRWNTNDATDSFVVRTVSRYYSHFLLTFCLLFKFSWRRQQYQKKKSLAFK